MSILERVKNYFSAPAPHVRDEVREREYDEHHATISPKEKRQIYKNKLTKTTHHNAETINQHEMVLEGLGVWAWIERRGEFYYGDIPNIRGIMYSNRNNSHEECERNLQHNIDNSMPASFTSFRQGIAPEEILNEHPNAEVIFLPIHRK